MAEAETKSEGAAKKSTRRPPKRKQVEDHARSYFEAIGRRDVDAAVDHWDPEGIEDVVPMKVFRGKDEIRGFLEENLNAMPSAEWVVESITADDSAAAVRWRISGTFDGSPFQGIQPNGKHVELRGCDVLEISDGKITRNSAYFDTMTFARQVGMMPPQDSGAERAMTNAFNAVTKLRARVGR